MICLPGGIEKLLQSNLCGGNGISRSMVCVEGACSKSAEQIMDTLDHILLGECTNCLTCRNNATVRRKYLSSPRTGQFNTWCHAQRRIVDGAAHWIEYAPQSSRGGASPYRPSVATAVIFARM